MLMTTPPYVASYIVQIFLMTALVTCSQHIQPSEYGSPFPPYKALSTAVQFLFKCLIHNSLRFDHSFMPASCHSYLTTFKFLYSLLSQASSVVAIIYLFDTLENGRRNDSSVRFRMSERGTKNVI